MLVWLKRIGATLAILLLILAGVAQFTRDAIELVEYLRHHLHKDRIILRFHQALVAHARPFAVEKVGQ